MANEEWQMNTAIRKAERTLDALGKGPLSLGYLKLDEDRMQMYFSPWEREYHNLVSGEEVITVRSAVNRDLLYVVDVTATSVLQAMADLWALLAKKF